MIIEFLAVLGLIIGLFGFGYWRGRADERHIQRNQRLHRAQGLVPQPRRRL